MSTRAFAKKKKKKCLCDRRDYVGNDKFQKDLIWIIWDIFFYYVKDNQQKNKLINGLLNLFTLKYTSTCNKSRRYILYTAVSILVDNVNFNINLVNDKVKVSNILEKLDNIYKQVKKNEIAPKTDYLFINNSSKSNLDKTIEKLNMMDKFL